MANLQVNKINTQYCAFMAVLRTLLSFHIMSDIHERLIKLLSIVVKVLEFKKKTNYSVREYQQFL